MQVNEGDEIESSIWVTKGILWRHVEVTGRCEQKQPKWGKNGSVHQNEKLAIGPALESSRFMKRGLGSLPNLSDLISHSVTITWIVPKIPRDFPKSRNSGRWVKTGQELTKHKSGGSGTAEERMWQGMWAILLKTRMRLHGCRWMRKCQQDKPLAGTAELAALYPSSRTFCKVNLQQLKQVKWKEA
ncbi:hypothetical protein EDB84DRAFT_1445203 [Lactarius hengduanensis]|nr:hypothetical protein EDB84DRAFT_1445203 [Lactarius hengduanensis]